jgi:Tfp pilus assembly protein PilO
MGMKIKIEQRERVIIGIVILIVISIAVYRLLFIPRIRKIGNIRKDIEVLSIKARDARGLEKGISGLEEEVLLKQKEFSLFKEGLVEKIEISQAISQLSQAGQKHDLKFISIKPSDIREAEVVSIGKDLSCCKLLITMDIEGKYNNLGRYLEELENLPLITRVEHIEIHGKEDILPNIKAVLIIAMYVKG